MTSEDSPFDWRDILREIREGYTSEGSARERDEAKYQSEQKSFERMFEENPDMVPSREDAEKFHNVFDALMHYWNIGAPIPPELIHTILSLYQDVYLSGGGKVSLEKVFFSQSGKSQYVTTRSREKRDNMLQLEVQLGTQFEGKTQDQVLNEIADRMEQDSDKEIDPKKLERHLNRVRKKKD